MPLIGPLLCKGPDTLNPNGQAISNIPLARMAYGKLKWPRALLGPLAINQFTGLAARGAGALPLPLALPILHQGMGFSPAAGVAS